MVIRGWDARYAEIREKFAYSRKKDTESARLLDSVISGKTRHAHLKRLVHARPVFVIGAGPSITRSLGIVKKYNKVTKIAADSAAEFLIKNRVYPEIVVTDLDGDQKSLQRAAQKGIMVVHAHGDNMERIQMVQDFPRCIGTTQTRQVGKIANFGGFTDGDRAVFLADHFGASQIILLGMDLGDRIGRYSGTKKSDRRIKLQKLQEARHLISWLAGRNPRIFSTSAIEGVTKISHRDIGSIII